MHVFNLLKQFPCHIVILVRYAAILDAASSFRKKIQQKNMYKLMTLKKKKKMLIYVNHSLCAGYEEHHY